MADSRQISAGVDAPLYARAFVVADPDAGSRVAIVIADIWAATRRLKDEVLERLATTHPGVYTDATLLLAGTHTHSAPGGYSGSLMYDFDLERGGCDEATVACIATGCVRALEMAHTNLAPGRIYVNRGDVVDCGRNRSPQAYVRNPQAERDQWGADTDREMLLLKFLRLDNAQPIGCLNWYPIHPTDLGQKNKLISGDSKGYASALLEQEISSKPHAPFVAAFANANCGDVSGNVELGHIPDGVHDRAQMEKHGRQQSDVARSTASTLQPRRSPDPSTTASRAWTSRTWPPERRESAPGRRRLASRSPPAAPRTASRVPDLGIREGITANTLDVGDAVICGRVRTGSQRHLRCLGDRSGDRPRRAQGTPAQADRVHARHREARRGAAGAPRAADSPGHIRDPGHPGRAQHDGRAPATHDRARRPASRWRAVSGARHLRQRVLAVRDHSRRSMRSQQYEGASTLFGPTHARGVPAGGGRTRDRTRDAAPRPRRARRRRRTLRRNSAATGSGTFLARRSRSASTAPTTRSSCSRSPTARRRSALRRSPTPSGSSPAHRCRPSSGSRSE